jgi:hypothetical protein
VDIKEIRNSLDLVTQDLESITDQKSVVIIRTLLNLVEVLVAENMRLREEVQELKDEINRLKGEQGKPTIRPQSGGEKQNKDHSSEKKRKIPKSKNPKRKKKGNISIDRHVTCQIDKENLPEDVVFKGYETVVIQDIHIVTDNVEFKKEVYYSPSLKKTFLAELPSGYQGEFGPRIRALVLTLYNDGGMTQPAIGRFFQTFGIDIAPSTISRMITDEHESFHQEKDDIVAEGMKSTSYQQIDDTSARVNGKNHYTHILCNPYYTAYFTTRKKDRLTVLELLNRGALKFSLNEESYQLMRDLGVIEKHIERLREETQAQVLTRDEIDKALTRLFPNPKKQKKNRHTMLEASAIVHYRNAGNSIEFLVCDDAPQFHKIARHRVLCWIHEGRHYMKLNPVVPLHKKSLEEVIDRLWLFYRKLLYYKNYPTERYAKKLSEQFDALFSKKTGYDVLDQRMARTLSKKEELLLVLQHPFLPLHNNESELGARVQARKRDVNLQTKNAKGTEAKDTFATIVQTARKLGVNIHDYLYDRITKSFKMPSLASIISDKPRMHVSHTS